MNEYQNYLVKIRGFKDFNEYKRNKNHESGRSQSMSENKECSSYLGVNIGEKYLSKIWDKLIRMPYGNKGFDWLCGKGLKIQGKTACISNSKIISTNGCENHYDVFNFDINKNKIADYFLLLAFDNRIDLNPLHIWLIKGTEIIGNRKFNDKQTFKIFNTKKSLSKYKKYELTDKLEHLKECCNSIK